MFMKRDHLIPQIEVLSAVKAWLLCIFRPSEVQTRTQRVEIQRTSFLSFSVTLIYFRDHQIDFFQSNFDRRLCPDLNTTSTRQERRD